MARPVNPDLNIAWKLVLPATLAGRVEYALMDPVLNKPIYGSRNKLVTALLTRWLEQQSGMPEANQSPVPSLLELRKAS